MSNKKCNCNEPYDPDYFQGGYPYCPIHDNKPITTPDTQLPAEVVECVNNWIVTFALAYHKQKNKDIANDAAEYLSDELAMPNELTAYAIKLNQAQQEIESLKGDIDVRNWDIKKYNQGIESLKRWKEEAAALLDPIFEYGHSKEASIPVGRRVIETVLERCKRYEAIRALLEKIVDRYGITADKEFYNEIKTFLDGAK